MRDGAGEHEHSQERQRHDEHVEESVVTFTNAVANLQIKQYTFH